MMHRFYILIVLSVLISSCGTMKVEEMEYGVSKAEISGITKTDDNAHPYRYEANSLTIIRQTDSIPAVIGTQFGIVYKIISAKKGEVKVHITWEYPEGMKDDSGKPNKQMSYYVKKTLNENTYAYYSLDTPSELTKGKWTIRLRVDGKLLHSHTFYLI